MPSLCCPGSCPHKPEWQNRMDVENVVQVAIEKLIRHSIADRLRDMQGLATARFFGRGRSEAEPGVARTKVAHCFENS